MLGRRLPPWATATIVLTVVAYCLLTAWGAVRQIQQLADPQDEGRARGQMYEARVS
jgi:hypothetical protein